MKDLYVMQNGMTKEQMFSVRLMDGFDFAPIIADAVLELKCCESMYDPCPSAVIHTCTRA